MGKKICYTLCLAVCLLLAVSVSAFAAEVPVVALPEIAPAVLHTESEPAFSLFSGEAQPEPLAWGEDSTCYRDQLKIYCDTVLEGDRTAVNMYDALVTAFETDWYAETEAERLHVEGVKFSDGEGGTIVIDCWTAPIVKATWSVAEFREAYKDYEPVEDGENKIPAWEFMIQYEAESWMYTQAANLLGESWLTANAFVNDHPEYFWIRANGGLGWVVEEGAEEWSARVYYGFMPLAGCETLEKRVALQEEIEEVMADLQKQTAGMTAVQKIIYWDNWLAEQNAYNYGALSTGLETSSYPWSVVGGLLPEHDPVCEGYAKALQLLCKWSVEEVDGIKIDASIPCVQISGDANGDHMWLAIRMEDGKWYYCDPTWNDPTVTFVDQHGNPIETKEYSYSSRQHLLTVQPNDHIIDTVPLLGTPTLSPVSYFDEMGTTVEETMSTWEVTEDGLTGMEAGSGAMMVILYDENGKMLDLGFCAQGAQCGEDSWFYLAPVFDAEDLAQATRIVRINVGDKTAWSPLTALKAIKEAPEAEPPEAE